MMDGTEGSPGCSVDAASAFSEPVSIPGLLQAEDFDLEGYSDDTPGNQGEAYRPDENVDIRALPFAGQVVSWMNAGEWLEYTVDVELAGTYRVLLRAAALESGRTLELSSCGDVLAEFQIPTVPELDVIDTVDAEVHLEAGLQVLRFSVGELSELDFDRFSLELLERADGGELPGWIGVEGDPGEVPRFVGNITTFRQADTADLVFSDYWDQITPENAGKWGSIQRTTASAPDWTTLDALYNYAMDNGLAFKQHAFVWGTQQPTGDITEEDVRRWMHMFCERYPRTHMIDVVNEPPPHTTPSYVDAIGGGTNGDWQWITNAFIWAREACPNAVLILNDYNIIEWDNDNQHFIDIVNTVLANGGPIDAVGAQSHDLDEGSVSFSTVSRLLDKLHNDTGLPVYISEMDISTQDDAQQLELYQTYFPHFWGKEYVQGVTIWGWIYGRTWNQAPDSGLVRDGESRPAMTWLMGELGRPAP